MTGKWSIPQVEQRCCVACLRPIHGKNRMYCEEDRISARRRSWRNSKRRRHGYKGVVVAA